MLLRVGGCPISGDLQGKFRSGPEQPVLTVDIPVLHRGVGLQDL